MNHPKAFIGSSSEGLAVAKALLACLEDEPIDAVLWKDQGFGLSTTPIESLEQILNEYSFGIFILTKDDLLTYREEELAAPRDNVVFEIGLWLGRWGRKNCAIVSEAGSDLKLPSDLGSLTRAEFELPDVQSLPDLKKALRKTASKVADSCQKAASENRLQIPARWLWQKLIDTDLPTVIAVASPLLLRPRIVGDEPALTRVADMEYVMSRQYTGMGETEAVGRIFDVLAGMGNHRFPLVFAAADVPYNRLHGPVILLGGYYSNRLSESILMRDNLPIQMRKDGITIKGKHYEPSLHEDAVVDYASIVWCANPFNPDQRLLLSAGYHSSGTVGGIDYLTHSYGKIPGLEGNENFMAVLCVRSVGTNREFPELIELIPF